MPCELLSESLIVVQVHNLDDRSVSSLLHQLRTRLHTLTHNALSTVKNPTVNTPVTSSNLINSSTLETATKTLHCVDQIFAPPSGPFSPVSHRRRHAQLKILRILLTRNVSRL